MRVYFVRHGESEGNRKEIHQTSQSPLSDIGRDQARYVAHRFKTIQIDALLASPYVRTLQTAEAIADVKGMDIEEYDLFREIKRPTEIEGMHYLDPEAVVVKQEMAEHIDDPEWHYSDEDTVFDLKYRALRALELLEARTEKNLAVVTHGTFLRVMIGVMMHGENYMPEQYLRLSRFLSTQNTGLTVCEYGSEWRLVTWNDQAHLG